MKWSHLCICHLRLHSDTHTHTHASSLCLLAKLKSTSAAKPRWQVCTCCRDGAGQFEIHTQRFHGSVIHLETMASCEESRHEACCSTPEVREEFHDRQFQKRCQDMRCAECLNKHDKEGNSEQMSGWKISIYSQLEDESSSCFHMVGKVRLCDHI